MATGVASWSQTAATNATADSNVNWAEGMAPSQVNDSARAMMASVAKYRDDLAGASGLTTGTATAYTFSSNQVFPSLAAMDGKTISVRWHTMSLGAATLNIDGLGAEPILVDGVTQVSSGMLRKNVIQDLTYFNGTGWVVKNGLCVLYPRCGDYSLPSLAQNLLGTYFLNADGSSQLRATWPDLFAMIGTTYGSSDGASFKLPNQGTIFTVPYWIRT